MLQSQSQYINVTWVKRQFIFLFTLQEDPFTFAINHQVGYSKRDILSDNKRVSIDCLIYENAFLILACTGLEQDP